MNLYISLKWLEEHIEVVSYEGMWHETETDEFVSVKDIHSAPSIDIVCCGECKWYDGKGHCKLRYGSLGVFEDVRTDDFCSYGSRSEKPNNSKGRSE